MEKQEVAQQKPSEVETGETITDITKLLDRIEDVFDTTKIVMQTIVNRANLRNGWIISPEQAQQVIGTAATSTVMKLVADYLENAPKPSKIKL